MITTRKHVEQHMSDVTPEMLELAAKVYSLQLKANIYLVLSTSGTLNDDGTPVEYSVSYTPGRGFSCTCPSGERGFANVKHPSHVCCHCRIATALAAEERAYAEAMERKATEQKRLERAVVTAQLESVGLKPCTALDCLQTANPATGKCVAHKPKREHVLNINGREATDEEYERVMNAKPAKVVKHGCYQPKAFSIL